MTRSVHCQKLGKESEGLDQPPYPGELGQRIYDSISKQAWQEWLARQTMLINEKRLKVFRPDDRKFLETEMEAWLFGGVTTDIEGFTPKDE